jgi:hypothetical protein
MVGNSKVATVAGLEEASGERQEKSQKDRWFPLCSPPCSLNAMVRERSRDYSKGIKRLI